MEFINFSAIETERVHYEMMLTDINEVDGMLYSLELWSKGRISIA